MAMQTVLYNNFYCNTNQYLGTTNDSGVSDKMKHNAEQIFMQLSAAGYTLNAISGILGNFHHESTLSPAFIEGANRWRLPNGTDSLAAVPNEVMQNHYKKYYTGQDGHGGYGLGLGQWDGLGITRQKLVGYAMNNGYQWYDGYIQIRRVIEQKDAFYTVRIGGVDYNWSTYPTGTGTPEQMAEAWRAGWEVGGDSSVATRQANARYWYNYFEHYMPLPVRLILLSQRQRKTLHKRRYNKDVIKY